jgi:anaerobic ribonucleoside-triphosphate reductase activating protein
VSELRVNGIVEESVVDGPGLRFTVFTQGCPHHCPGCHNPETHDPCGGHTVSTEKLLAQIQENPLLAGVTFSGGEPFLQAAILADLGSRVRALDKTVVVYTGYTLEQLHGRAKEHDSVNALLEQADLLIDGPYVEALRDLEILHRGSANQRILTRRDILSIRKDLLSIQTGSLRDCTSRAWR